jgi:hypothetical protein
MTPAAGRPAPCKLSNEPCLDFWADGNVRQDLCSFLPVWCSLFAKKSSRSSSDVSCTYIEPLQLLGCCTGTIVICRAALVAVAIPSLSLLANQMWPRWWEVAGLRQSTLRPLKHQVTHLVVVCDFTQRVRIAKNGRKDTKLLGL